MPIRPGYDCEAPGTAAKLGNDSKPHQRSEQYTRPHPHCVAGVTVARGRLSIFPYIYSTLVKVHRSATERDFGVERHGLADKLPQICPKKLTRKLVHSLACGGVL